MTVFVVHKCKPSISGKLCNFSSQIATGVYATCANVKIVGSIIQYLIEHDVQFTVVNEPVHGIAPVTVNY